MSQLDHTARRAVEALERLQVKYSRLWEAGAAIAGLEAIRALQTRITELEANSIQQTAGKLVDRTAMADPLYHAMIADDIITSGEVQS